jgi:hypothetical protein
LARIAPQFALCSALTILVFFMMTLFLSIDYVYEVYSQIHVADKKEQTKRNNEKNYTRTFILTFCILIMVVILFSCTACISLFNKYRNALEKLSKFMRRFSSRSGSTMSIKSADLTPIAKMKRRYHPPMSIIKSEDYEDELTVSLSTSTRKHRPSN